MKYLDKFDNFKPVNEDKFSRAERKKEKAEDLLDDIDSAIKAGNDDKAEKLLKRATKKVDRAEELNPSIDTEEIATQLTQLHSELSGEIAPEDKFDFTSKDRRDKIKMDNFDITNKIKILGNEISNDEVQMFLQTVNNYLDEYWNKLKDGNEFPREYTSPHTGFTIEVKRKFGRTVFLHKEDANDKIKIVFNNRDFDNDENKAVISAELADVKDSENIKKEVEANYAPEKDEELHEPTAPEQFNTVVPPAVEAEIEHIATQLTTKDDYFISESVKMLIDEELNISYSNTDEDKIFNFFVKTNPKKTIVYLNVDDILIKYRKKKATMNESWYNDLGDLEDATIGATNRATQSMRTQASKGVVGDLMWAFNTDARTLSEDINQALAKIGSAYQKEFDKAVEKLPSLKEKVDTTDVLAGMLGSGYALKKSPRLARLFGIRGGASASTPIARGGAGGLARMGRFLTNPYVLIGVAVVAALGSGWYLWNSFDEQQNQLATIFLLMWASGSTEFHKELKQNGIVIKAPQIDMTKLNNLIQSGEMFSEEAVEEEPIEETQPEEVEDDSLPFENYSIKRFKDFGK